MSYFLGIKPSLTDVGSKYKNEVYFEEWAAHMLIPGLPVVWMCRHLSHARNKYSNQHAPLSFSRSRCVWEKCVCDLGI